MKTHQPRTRGYLVPGLQHYRRQQMLTQLELAVRAHTTQITISNGERGKRLEARIIRRLAEALGMTPEALITDLHE